MVTPRSQNQNNWSSLWIAFKWIYSGMDRRENDWREKQEREWEINILGDTLFKRSARGGEFPSEMEFQEDWIGEIPKDFEFVWCNGPFDTIHFVHSCPFTQLKNGQLSISLFISCLIPGYVNCSPLFAQLFPSNLICTHLVWRLLSKEQIQKIHWSPWSVLPVATSKELKETDQTWFSFHKSILTPLNSFKDTALAENHSSDRLETCYKVVTRTILPIHFYFCIKLSSKLNPSGMSFIFQGRHRKCSWPQLWLPQLGC